jgi:methionyl-tRNA formyltransferase
MVPKKIRDIATYGTWGIHASMLPNYAGGAPLVWAIINGETETGVTLFKLDDGVDDGDIIEQEIIVIENVDTIKEVYEKVIIVSKTILLKALKNISKIVFKPQDKSKIKVFPQRKPQDGELDLTKPAQEIYNFIRAQSSPYPGAFIKTSDGKKLIIEKARIE